MFVSVLGPSAYSAIIASVIAQRKRYDRPLLMDMIGVPDTFGESGQPWELMKAFGLTAEHVAERRVVVTERLARERQLRDARDLPGAARRRIGHDAKPPCEHAKDRLGGHTGGA
jgi:hypothetical protein